MLMKRIKDEDILVRITSLAPNGGGKTYRDRIKEMEEEQMTKQEFREHPEYFKAKEKIIAYPKGYKFKIRICTMTQAKLNAMKILLQDCENEGLIENLSIDLDLQGNITEYEYVRK